MSKFRITYSQQYDDEEVDADGFHTEGEFVDFVNEDEMGFQTVAKRVRAKIVDKIDKIG